MPSYEKKKHGKKRNKEQTSNSVTRDHVLIGKEEIWSRSPTQLPWIIQLPPMTHMNHMLSPYAFTQPPNPPSFQNTNIQDFYYIFVIIFIGEGKNKHKIYTLP